MSVLLSSRRLVWTALRRASSDSSFAIKTADAHRHRTIPQLLRAIFVLKLSSISAFAKHAEKLYSIGQKTVGRRLTGSLSSVFFHQFVAGESDADLATESKKLLSLGNIRLMLCPPMEDLKGSCEHFEAMARRNADICMSYLETADRINKEQPGQYSVMQFKHSAVFPVEAMDIVSEQYMRNKVPLKQKTLEYADMMDKPFSASSTNLNQEEKCMELGLKLCQQIFKKAQSLNVPIIMDAELWSSYYAMVAVNLASMIHYNSKTNPHAFIFGTYQCYLKEVMGWMEESLRICEQTDVRFGAKLVRGAYLEYERLLAKKTGRPSPIHPSAEATSVSYDAAVSFLLRRLQSEPNSLSLLVASHNERSVRDAVRQMTELGIQPGDPSVNFGQIYGMCDHLSFALGRGGYNVWKSTPWGPISEWMPYLSRRAAENFVAFRSARNELPLYRQELFSRLGRRRANLNIG